MTYLKFDPKYPNTYHIYVDGSFRPPDNASCAYLIIHQKKKDIINMASYAHRGMTINQMELMAINHALDFRKMDSVIIYTDSVYAMSSLTIWKKAWERNNWISSTGEPVKNKDIILEISNKLDKKRFVKFIKVKAHSDNVLNNMVDYLAQRLSSKMRDNPLLPDGEYISPSKK